MPTKKVVNKTRKAVSKRFKVTASGKVKRNRQGKRHLLSSKSPKPPPSRQCHVCREGRYAPHHRESSLQPLRIYHAIYERTRLT